MKHILKVLTGFSGKILAKDVLFCVTVNCWFDTTKSKLQKREVITIEIILSVGIDIGTTTTQIVFSRITLENMASFTSVPRIKIVAKEVIYRSKIYFTPLLSVNEIDYDGIVRIVAAEYAAAGINKEDLATGAVIITGETSRKNNAETVLKLLSGYAGNFVVATAGPDLESILAGKGAGAHTLSVDTGKTIANFDIGGGTTNISVFRQGEIIATTCLDIGGRLVKFENDRISYIATNIQWLAQYKNIKINVGDRRTDAEPAINALTSAMVGILADAASGKGLPDVMSHMYSRRVNHDEASVVSPLDVGLKIDAITFSGGVADSVYNPAGLDRYIYGDIGIVLGEAVKNSSAFQNFEIIRPAETINATVIGAGIHTIEISGSTIEYSEHLLPLKNIPIIKLTTEDEARDGQSFPNLAAAIRRKLSWYQSAGSSEFQTAAFALKGFKNPSYAEILALASALAAAFDEYVKAKLPIIIILEHDMAKALGQTLKINLKGHDIVCIDGVNVESGDYVDIGLPLANGRVTPVVIKTLCL